VTMVRLAPNLSEHTGKGPVLTKAALRAAERLGLTARVLSRVIGVSEPTVSRMRKGDFLLEEGSKPYELAVLLVRVFRSLDAITGGDERVSRAWLAAPNTALGSTPAEQIITIAGLTDVIAYLDARRAVL
jgi:hypothetical protein